MDMRLYNSSSAWFLAQIKPNCAKIADRNLKRQGFETFLPTEEDTKQRRGQFVTTMRQMFPGYIFVAIDRTESRWQTVNSTYGVTRLVSFGDAPAVVPFDLISELMSRCDEAGKLVPADQFQPGEQALVTSGPFSALLAEIEGAAPDQRVWVLMDIMGRPTRVAVKAEQLRAI